jgi:aromatic-L-amino-acid decarboxylase
VDANQRSNETERAARRDLYQLSSLEAIVPSIMDWIAQYWTNPRVRPVYQPGNPGDVLAALPTEIPVQAEDLNSIFKDFDERIAPGLLHWNHPGFFGFFPCNTSGPSVAGALLAAAIDVNPFSWNAGPAGVELEMRLVQWLSDAIGLKWKGCLQDTASSASLCAIIAARERALTATANDLGKLVAYVSTESHSSVAKGAFIAGLARHQIRSIATLDDLAMDPQALHAAMTEDSKKGLIPFFVCTTLGTTSSTAFDKPDSIQDVIDELFGAGVIKHKPWHHVDAALAGCAAILPEMAWMMRGVDRTDSFVFNPHKWLFTNFECSVLLVREPRAYKAALSADPEYLVNHLQQQHEVEDFRNWTVQLGRGFRGLKLWFVLRAYGLAKLQLMIRNHLAMTKRLYQTIETQLQKDEDRLFVTLCEPRLNTICLRMRTEELTHKLLQILTNRGQIYLTPTRIRGTFWLRIAIGQTAVLQSDIDYLWSHLQLCGLEAIRATTAPLAP